MQNGTRWFGYAAVTRGQQVRSLSFCPNGRLAEWSIAADCKSVILRGGSNPSPPTIIYLELAKLGIASGLGPEDRGFESPIQDQRKSAKD